MILSQSAGHCYSCRGHVGREEGRAVRVSAVTERMAVRDLVTHHSSLFSVPI